VKQRIYILVADLGRAKIYKSETPVKALELVFDQVNFQGKKKPSEIYSDKAGGQHSGFGGYHNFAGERRNNEDDRFSRELANMLKNEYQAGKFDVLALISPPHFLGKLRQNLDKECQKIVIRSIDKDLLRMTEQDIINHLT
jgi:protein required for attachment to host cells